MCVNCNKSSVKAPCEVCIQVDGDYTEKKVKFCKLCVVYICERCWTSVPRRTIAATKTGINALIGTFGSWLK